MPELPIHAVTRAQLAAFAKQPSHAVLLSGPAGTGKRSLARQTARTLLSVERLDDYPYVRIVAPTDKGSIGIEAIRELEQFLRLRVPRDSQVTRAVIIEEAHQLTQEAQNALLKTLEEPPVGTVIVLTASQSQALLPTIRSRSQTISVQSPDQAVLEKHFAADFPEATVRRAYAMSGGLPGLMQALLTQADHPLLLAADTARDLLGQSAYERLLAVDKLTKDRQLSLDMTEILQQMAHISLQTANGSTAQRWQKVLQASYEASEALRGNGQPKLVLDRLMLSL